MQRNWDKTALINAPWQSRSFMHLQICNRERTGLVVRASDSESGDPGWILGRVGVLFPWARDIYSQKRTGNTQE